MWVREAIIDGKRSAKSEIVGSLAMQSIFTLAALIVTYLIFKDRLSTGEYVVMLGAVAEL